MEVLPRPYHCPPLIYWLSSHTNGFIDRGQTATSFMKVSMLFIHFQAKSHTAIPMLASRLSPRPPRPGHIISGPWPIIIVGSGKALPCRARRINPFMAYASQIWGLLLREGMLKGETSTHASVRSPWQQRKEDRRGLWGFDCYHHIGPRERDKRCLDYSLGADPLRAVGSYSLLPLRQHLPGT